MYWIPSKLQSEVSLDIRNSRSRPHIAPLLENEDRHLL